MDRDDFLDRAVAFMFEDFWKLFLLGVLLVGAVHFTSLTWSQVTNPPLWVKVGAVFVVVAGVVGYLVMSTWYTPPEPDWNLVVSINLDSDRLLDIRKATDAVVKDLANNTLGGSLGHVTGTSVYYCRWWNRDPENPLGHATWDNVDTDAELLGRQAGDVEDEVAFIRESYESRIYKADRIRTHFPIIVRMLQSRKAESLNAALEGHLAPDLGGSTIDTIIDDVMPEDIQPESFRKQLERAKEEVGESAESLVDEIETENFDEDAPEVSDLPDTTDNGSQPAMPDGGENE